jgi:hypothetical protein
MATLKNTDINDTGYLKLPVGTTEERPVSPQTGYIRYNSTTQIVELYNGTDWVDLTISFLTIDGDVYIDNTVLLLQGDDNPSGITNNNTFKDSSTNNFTITRNGNVTQGTFSPFDRALTNSGGSAYFDGTGDYLSTPANSALNFGSGAYTIEAWINMATLPTSGNVQPIYHVGVHQGGTVFHELDILNSSGTYFLTGNLYNGSSYVYQVSISFTASINTWYHVAFIYTGTQAYVSLNGVLSTKVTASGTCPNSTVFIGYGPFLGGLNYFFNGYISNLRVVKGTAVYTSNFNPSTIPLTAITNTSLLLNFTNAAIFDGVKLNNIETVGGAQISTAQSKFGGSSMYFDGTDFDAISLPASDAFNFGSGNFTIELFYYRHGTPQTYARLFQTRDGDTVAGISLVHQETTNQLALYLSTNGTSFSNTFLLNTISNNTWTHIALVRDGNNLYFYFNGTRTTLSTTLTITLFYTSSTKIIIGGSTTEVSRSINGFIDELRVTKGIARYTGPTLTVPTSKLSSLIPNYLVSKSLRFNSADSTYLSRTPTVAGNRTTWTWSGWVKIGALTGSHNLFSNGGGISTSFSAIRLESDSTISIFDWNGTAFVWRVGPSMLFRDFSAWYHIVVAIDTNQVTPSNRVKIYINGTLITSFFVSSYPSQGLPTYTNSTISARIGATFNGSVTDEYFNGYMSEVNFIDGQALTPDSFGIRNTSTGVWSPKEYTGTYGTNGFHLNFSDITQLGKDYSGNNNNWTPSGFSVTPGVGYDSLTDVPTPNGTDTGFGGEVRGNYATLNPLANNAGTLANGNLYFSTSATYQYGSGTIAIPSSGKWIFEVTFNTTPTSNNYNSCGVVTGSFNRTGPFTSTGAYGVEDVSIYGQRFVQNGIAQGSITLPSGTVIQCLIDRDAGTLTFTKNGTLQTGNGSTVTLPASSVELFAVVGQYNNSVTANFGQRPFAYTPPTGFKTLNTANLPTPAIGGGGESNLANKYMDITTYTGTGTAQSIFNSGFKPDFVWIKSRSAATSHAIYDNIRGVQKRLSTDSTAAEVTDTTGLSSFDDYGFSIGALSQINTSGATYVAWQWRAGDTVSTNISGTITSQVRVSTLSGFSLVTYTGTGSNATVGHGLDVAPKMIIVKNRGGVYSWLVYHNFMSTSLPATWYMSLNQTNGASNGANVWVNVPTSTVFTVSGSFPEVNGSTNTYVAYCFAEIEGYSKFGSYLGNNSTNGTFVYTGFKPKYILIKCSTATTNWVLYNSIVNAGNPVVNELFANLNNAENSVTSGDEIDFLSNGFKLRSTNAAINAAQTYIYAAFAETPFKYATAALTPEVKETVTVDYLVVAGGGGGGKDRGGGGGAGGFRQFTNQNLNKGTSYTVTVGGGGAGSTNTVNKGVNGNISTFNSNSSTAGGGGGSSGNINGNSGGSGGGGWSISVGSGGTGGSGNTGSYSPVEGYAGGNGESGGNRRAGGGGGAGESGNTDGQGFGGDGLTASINGNTYAGGGGGGVYSGSGGTGGDGGGGNGGAPNTSGSNGLDNRGGGGGGAGDTSGNGGNGGSGVVILRWLTSDATITVGAGLSSNSTGTDGLYSYKVFTQGVGNITFN